MGAYAAKCMDAHLSEFTLDPPPPPMILLSLLWLVEAFSPPSDLLGYQFKLIIIMFS